MVIVSHITHYTYGFMFTGLGYSDPWVESHIFGSLDICSFIFSVEISDVAWHYFCLLQFIVPA